MLPLLISATVDESIFFCFVAGLETGLYFTLISLTDGNVVVMSMSPISFYLVINTRMMKSEDN